ncbi:MAG TPA: transposase [Nodosilinea sp.]|nr:transposase [Nodosilinea sp.]
MPKPTPQSGRPANDYRVTSNGTLWVLHTGAPGRDLPDRYGVWEPVSGRRSPISMGGSG